MIHYSSSKPAVVIFCATEEEFRGLLRGFAQAAIIDDGDETRMGALEGEHSRLLLVCSGIGAERTRACAQRLLTEERQVRLVLSTGIAGILAPGPDLGHIVLSHRVWSCRKGALRLCGSAAAPERPVWDAIRRQAAKEGPARTAMTVHCGPLVSSDTPIADAALARRLYQQTGALCVEMEAAGVEPVCRAAGIPFLAVKIMSDFADREAFLSMLRHQKTLCGRLGRLLAGVWNETEFLC